MSSVAGRLRQLALLGLLFSLVGCGLPRSGPSYSEITSTEQGDLGFEVVLVDDRVTAATQIDERSGFDVSYVKTPEEPTARIARGDLLSITVWENIDEGLLNPTGVGATPLPTVKVDERGMIFIPYVGLVKAEGKTLQQLRAEVRRQLSTKTLNPQVDVLPGDSRGRIISVQGAVNSPGLYPIEEPTRRLLPMLARAGGIAGDPETIRIQLRRGDLSGEIWLQDLYDDPRNNIPLRAGDAVIAERDRRIFTALGALRGPSTQNFPTRELSVARALGTVGGLIDQTADPTGVFLFREEPVEIAQRLFPEKQITEPVEVAYLIDLTEPAGMFHARDFMMRDRDTLYVTNAPFTKWQKILQGITPVVGFASSVNTLPGL